MIKGWIRIIIFIIGVLVVIGAVLEYTRYFEKETTVQTATVKMGEVEEVVKMSGLVDSENTETIISNAEGIISNLRIKEGDRIREGEGLCSIRSPSLRAELLGMQAELMTASENMEKAATAAEREMARARYNFIKQNIADLGETMQPKAHINGEVIETEMQNGSKVVPGMTLFFLADMTRPVVKARMDEADVQRVKIGQPLWITGDFLSGKSLQGKILEISKFVDKEIGTYVETTCMIFNPKDLPLKYGAYADVRVITARKRNVLLIPNEALIVDEGKYVFTVEENRAHLTPIRVGIIGETHTEVRSGLRAGERVVTVGSLDLSDGDKIKYE